VSEGLSPQQSDQAAEPADLQTMVPEAKELLGNDGDEVAWDEPATGSSDERAVAQAGALRAPQAGGGEFPAIAPPAAIEVPGEELVQVSPAERVAPRNVAESVSGGGGNPGTSTSPAASDSGGKVLREALFEKWPKPSVALVLTGRQYGYLEPCGCSGLENQNGGLVRRSTLLKQLEERGWPVIPIDAGNQVRRFGRQAEIKFQITVEGLRKMGYQAIAFGPDDLRLPAPELVGIIYPNPDEPALFVGANVTVFDPSFTSAYRVLEKGGKKIGVTAVLVEDDRNPINNEDVILESAEAGIAKVWPQLQQAQCDLYVLIAHASLEESKELGRKFPQFRVVVSTGGAGEPPRDPDTIEGTDNWLVDVGTKGMFAGVVALCDDREKPLRYQRIPLDARFPDSRAMLELLKAYQDQLEAAGFEGLGIRPQPMPGGYEFVGSETCKDCHRRAYKVWKEGRDDHAAKHSHAYATLQHPPNSRGGIPRNFDPECISCHVVGWNPQKYFPYRSGFLSLEATPHLTDVGCENCHGPGSKHVAAESGDEAVDDDEMTARREKMWLDLKDAEQKCLECHDLDNSPDFQVEGAFERYWEKIEH
jgi:hypothetical protein